MNFDERVCKFQVKSVGLKNYYNILEIYAKDSQALIDKHLAELRSLMDEPNHPDKMEVELNEEGMAEWFGILFDNWYWMIFCVFDLF